jgi:DNA polymerase III alpha subunit (gram-positive type)
MKDVSNINFRDRKLIFIDLETTGLDPTDHEIVEAACIVVDGKNFSELGRYKAKVRPLYPEKMNSEVRKLIGYSEDSWSNAEDLKVVLNKVNSLSQGAMLVGWNITFDWAFLEIAFIRHGIKSSFDYHRIDVMSIAYAKLFQDSNLDGLGLRKVAPFLGIAISDAHGAEKDVQATFEIFKILMRK